jgi:galactonate dehydratase
MKVDAVETVVVGTPWRELTFVELVTDDGLRGVGEARMVNKTDSLVACIGELARRYVVGMDPFDTERLAWQFQWAEYGRAGEITQTALAAIDLACHDLMGQATGQPVWRLLGGRFRDRVPAYANGWYQGDRDPEVVARFAGEVVARGYRGLKIDPFGAATAELGHAELGLAADIIAAVRDAVGPETELMVEMHGRFTAATAVPEHRALEPV